MELAVANCFFTRPAAYEVFKGPPATSFQPIVCHQHAQQVAMVN